MNLDGKLVVAHAQARVHFFGLTSGSLAFFAITWNHPYLWQVSNRFKWQIWGRIREFKVQVVGHLDMI
ncbi:hypothetical protein L6452_33923 [Arctium lappa]|uniref:Uncharacterized protein n=1 Tax=Arctium lappa TaxID=4217 RepID=A0ACB8YHD7_ARCLA|nr:hypothetical protein L6452_33923 [Arctium lappa]